MNAFLQLLKKDWRLNRAPLIALAIAAAAPYLIGCCVNLYQLRDGIAEGHVIWSKPNLAHLMGSSSLMSVFCGGMVAAALGANAFATEKRERWADFLATIPATRPQIACSKLIVSLGSLGVFWCVDMAILLAAIHYDYDMNYDQSEAYPLICFGIATFGVAWFVSVFLSSAAISASISLIVVLSTAFVIANTSPFSSQTELIGLFSIAAGITALAAGCTIHTRRVAP